MILEGQRRTTTKKSKKHEKDEDEYNYDWSEEDELPEIDWMSNPFPHQVSFFLVMNSRLLNIVIIKNRLQFVMEMSTTVQDQLFQIGGFCRLLLALITIGIRLRYV